MRALTHRLLLLLALNIAEIAGRVLEVPHAAEILVASHLRKDRPPNWHGPRSMAARKGFFAGDDAVYSR